MPSPTRLKSDLMALVRTLPTVKDSVQAKQGLRSLRDELLYRKSGKSLQLDDAAKLDELHISDLLANWLQSPAGEHVLEDIEKSGDEVLVEFDKALKKVELVQVALAYVPPTDDLVRYHRWFNQVIGHPVMLEVSTDQELIAGISFSYQNAQHDYSLRKKMPEIEQVLLKKSKALAGEVKS